MIKEYKHHNDNLREAIVDLDENHMITYIQYYRKINERYFVSYVNYGWVKNFT